MTESDWLSCREFRKLLFDLLPKIHPQPSDRKLRLYCVAFCRWLGAKLDEPFRRAVEVAENYADGLATFHELTAVHVAAARHAGRCARVDRLRSRDQKRLTDGQDWFVAWKLIDAAARPERAVPNKTQWGPWFAATFGGGPDVLDEIAETQASALLADLLLDVLGNPFRTVVIDPAWLFWNDGAVPKFAETMYADRAFDRLPILADALEEAGCTDAAILEHCRGPGPHVRGCWMVDLLLNKS